MRRCEKEVEGHLVLLRVVREELRRQTLLPALVLHLCRTRCAESAECTESEAVHGVGSALCVALVLHVVGCDALDERACVTHGAWTQQCT